jgi:two-component sensor histidine kinase
MGILYLIAILFPYLFSSSSLPTLAPFLNDPDTRVVSLAVILDRIYKEKFEGEWNYEKVYEEN